jgi:hypothetical protein
MYDSNFNFNFSGRGYWCCKLKARRIIMTIKKNKKIKSHLLVVVDTPTLCNKTRIVAGSWRINRAAFGV